MKKESATLLRAEARRSFRQDKKVWSFMASAERLTTASVENVSSGVARKRPVSDESTATKGLEAMLTEMNASKPIDLADKSTSEEVDQKRNKEDSPHKQESSVQEKKNCQASNSTNVKVRVDNMSTTGEVVSEKKMPESKAPSRTGGMPSKNQVDDYSLPECKEVHQTSIDPKEEERVSVPAEGTAQANEPSGKEDSNRAEEQGEKTHPQVPPTVSPALTRPYKELQGFLTMSASLQKSHKEAELEELVNQLKIQVRCKQKEKVEADEVYRRDLRVRDDKIKKLNKDNARLEREKWELLRRAREAAERSVNLRTKLDLHDTSLRSVQQELQRVTDELSAVKSANNSLRLLVTDLRTPTPKSDASVQVEINSPAMQRSHSRGDTLTPHNLTENDGGGPLGRLATEFVTSDDWDVASLGSSHTDSRDGTPTTTPQLDRRGHERKSMRKLLSKFRRSSSSGRTHNSMSSMGKGERERERKKRRR